LAVTNFGVCGVDACGFWRYRMPPRFREVRFRGVRFRDVKSNEARIREEGKIQ